MGELLAERRFPARAAELEGVRARVREIVEPLFGPDLASDVVLAVDEACQNIIRHAYCGEDGMIELRMESDGDKLCISLEDFADCVDPGQVRPRDLADLKPGGLGTHLIREIMDEVELRPTGEVKGNLLRMVKRIR
jgi:sigma-B regulation protein RsbU (phosphoserine phosphatase)